MWSSAEAVDADITPGQADEERRDSGDQGHDSILTEENHSKTVSTNSMYKLLVHLRVKHYKNFLKESPKYFWDVLPRQLSPPKRIRHELRDEETQKFTGHGKLKALLVTG